MRRALKGVRRLDDSFYFIWEGARLLLWPGGVAADSVLFVTSGRWFCGMELPVCAGGEKRYRAEKRSLREVWDEPNPRQSAAKTTAAKSRR